MVDIVIDSITNCLLCAETQEEKDTVFYKMESPFSLSELRVMKEAGWKFDWNEPFAKGEEVYALTLTNDKAIQGLIALKHYPESYFTYVDIVEAAPWNVGRNGQYKGVGAHLFAIACKLSWDAGNDGYVQFVAKTNLVQHYIDNVYANQISAQDMYIDSRGALALIRKYFKEEVV